MLDIIKTQAETAVLELVSIANLKKNDIFVVGCSSSEISGHTIGTSSSVEIAQAVFESIYPILCEKGIFLAAQCCEHLNRALIIERKTAVFYNFDIVNVMPQPKAGGSFASIAYRSFKEPCAVEEIKAHAGIDIGNTLIGMHLKKVAVPIRLQVNKIGEAYISAARTRPKFIGGNRASYNENLL